MAAQKNCLVCGEKFTTPMKHKKTCCHHHGFILTQARASMKQQEKNIIKENLDLSGWIKHHLSSQPEPKYKIIMGYARGGGS